MTLLVLSSTNKESKGVYRYCCRCGKELSKYWLLCPACGNTVMITENTVVHTESSIPQKRKWVTLLLAIFLGCLGVHRFYVGKMEVRTALAADRRILRSRLGDRYGVDLTGAIGG